MLFSEVSFRLAVAMAGAGVAKWDDVEWQEPSRVTQLAAAPTCISSGAQVAKLGPPNFRISSTVVKNAKCKMKKDFDKSVSQSGGG